jgi:hypothetical protein
LAVYNSTGMGITQITTSASIANSILLQSTELSYPTWVGQSQLFVGGASTAANIYAGNQYQIPYQSAASTTTFITNAAGSGASVLTQTTGSAPVYLPQSQLFVGGASTATAWQTARTVTFTGDVTGSFSINGSADVSNVALTIGSNTVELGTDTTGNYVASVSASGSGISLIGTNGEGSSLTINSNATNLNTSSTIVFRDGSGNFSAGTITAALTGNATTATTATNVAGGAANRIVYNTSAGTSAFAVAPTASSTYLYWNGSAFAWGTVAQEVPVSLNDIVISSNYTFPSNKNAISVGPVTISSGVTVTVGSGQRWLVV